MRAYELAADGPPQRRRIDSFDAESELEALLEDLPPLLLDEDILIIDTQVSVATGTLDILGLDAHGNTIVFELKKGASGTGSASEGSILSQPMEYARALEELSAADLAEFYAASRADRPDDDTGDAAADPLKALTAAFERNFGQALDAEMTNHNQRMVIVAEEITDRTAANSRYLRDEGLHLQCVEVQQFPLAGADAAAVLVAATVVDYDDRRIQPGDSVAPTFGTTNEEIAAKAFEQVGVLTGGTQPLELFPKGFDHREPRLHSRHPDHPDGVRYAIRAHPFEDEHLMLSIDITDRGLDVDLNDDRKASLTAQLRAAESAFRGVDFEVSHRRAHWRVVTRSWPAETAADIRDSELIAMAADAYADLIRVGHDVFIDGTATGPDDGTV